MGVIRWVKHRLKERKRKRALERVEVKLQSKSARMKVFEAQSSRVFRNFLLSQRKGVREVAPPEFRERSGHRSSSGEYYSPRGLSVKRVTGSGKKIVYRAMISPMYGSHDDGHAYFIALHDHVHMRVRKNSFLAQFEDALAYPHSNLFLFTDIARSFPSQKAFSASILRLYRSKKMRPILDEMQQVQFDGLTRFNVKSGSDASAVRARELLGLIGEFLEKEANRYVRKSP